MCKQILSVILDQDWLAIAKAVPPIWLAIIATLALTTWKRQLKAKQKTELLDKLTTAVYYFKNHLVHPTVWFEVIKIDFQKNFPEYSKNQEQVAMNFISEKGKMYSNRLEESLKDCKEKRYEVENLIIQVEILNFIDHKNCSDACYQIIDQYSELATLAIDVGNINCTPVKAVATLDKVLTLNYEQIIDDLHKEHEKYLEFAIKNYKRIYK
jgi:hypothetical protein